MKTSLKKLGRFALHHRHVDPAQRRYLRSLSQLDELAQASQDLDDMRDCYDSLLAAAAATTNTAYEFSESLRELGSCLLEKTSLNDDEDSGKVLLMLGKMQFELQKLLDRYRSHISRTITIPSQSLLNELRTVEEMKRNCDEKRSLYEYMIMNYREKGRSRTGKGENFTMQQLQDAREQYDEEATLFIFRLKSLKQGQSRSLLTQAARHHTAQLQLLRNALDSLEAVEPHVRHVTEQQHIEYQLNGLNDDYSHEIDDEDDYDDDDSHYEDSYVGHDDKELSFDYRQYQVDNKSIKRHSMELDQVDITFPKVGSRENLKENIELSPREYYGFSGNNKAYTQSAPLFAENKPSDVTDRMPPMRQSSIRKLQTYVLPTPGEPKSPTSSKPAEAPPKNNPHVQNQMGWHSSPLQQPNNWRKSADEKFSGTFDINAVSILKESNKKSAPNILPPPLAEGLLFSQFDPVTASSSKKFKRQAYSGPLTKKTEPSQPLSEHAQLYSGPILRNNRMTSSSPKASHFSSPLASSPKISELHELPRPPAGSTGVSCRPPGLLGYSAPLAYKGSEDTSAKPENTLTGAASPLPRPPSFVSRSFSIPTSRSKISEAMQGRGKGETPEAGSPPSLKPISLTKS